MTIDDESAIFNRMATAERCRAGRCTGARIALKTSRNRAEWSARL